MRRQFSFRAYNGSEAYEVFTDVSTLYSFDFCQFVDEITVNMVI
jgi:hypothetical protein